MPGPIAPRLLSLIALGVLASPAIAGGCGGNSSSVVPQKNGTGGSSGSGSTTAGRGGSSGSATGGTDNRGGTGGKGGAGGSSGTMTIDDGGDAGESTGATGGSATGGTGANAGAGGKGGMSAGGAGSGQGGTAGQSAGSGGQSGSAGNGTSGAVGVLGSQCSPPGALACAGNYQKLTVLCGGNGMWQQNQTCGNDQFCDSTPGPNVGTCQPVAEGCEDGPGTTFCDENDPVQLVTCSADAVGTITEDCSGACRGDACREAPECPVWADYDDGATCAPECPRTSSNCMESSGGCVDFANITIPSGGSAVVRTAWVEDTCQVCAGTTAAHFSVNVSLPRALRVTVPPPWRVQPTGSSGCNAGVSGCTIFSTQFPRIIRFRSTTLEDGPVNILFEDVPPSATCPSEGGEGGQPG